MISEYLKYNLVANERRFSLESDPNHIIMVKLITNSPNYLDPLFLYDEFMTNKFVELNNIVSFYFNLNGTIQYEYLIRDRAMQNLVKNLKNNPYFLGISNEEVKQEILCCAEWLVSTDCKEYIKRLRKLKIYT